MKQYFLLIVIVYLLKSLEWASVNCQIANQTTTWTPRTTTRARKLPTTTRLTTNSTTWTRKPSLASTKTTFSSKSVATTTSTQAPSNEKVYDLVKKPAEIESTTNGTANRSLSDQEADKAENGSAPPIDVPYWRRFLDQFDQQTLILASAFIIFTLVILTVLLPVWCICKKMNKKKLPGEITVNPAYDLPVKSGSSPNGSIRKAPIYTGEPDFLDPASMSLLPSPADRRPLLNGVGPKPEYIEMEPLMPKKPASNESALSKSTSSLSSVDSRPVKSPLTPANERFPKPGFTPFSPDTPSSNIDLALSTTRYTPSHVNKTPLQITKESQNSASRRSLLANRRSELADNETAATGRPPLSKRVSVASSTSSIHNLSAAAQAPVNFEQAILGVDDLIQVIGTERTGLSESRTSLPTGPDSLQNSTSDIYAKAIAEKRDAMAKKTAEKSRMRTQISNLSSDTTASSVGTSNKAAPLSGRRSMGALNAAAGVSIDPNGGTGGGGGGGPRGLAQSRTESVNTLESEKSCY